MKRGAISRRPSTASSTWTEIDKIAASGNSYGPDVSRSGGARAIRKLSEESEVRPQDAYDLARR
jgi:ATP-dependent protease HslVU (ClpYQ) ATPase subunit